MEASDGVSTTPPADALVQSAPPVPDPGPSPSTTPAATDAPVVAEHVDDFVLDIPSIALSAEFVAGDQTQIDQGMVTAVDWTARGFPASCLPGDGCTIWLAGHRSTHGAVFARLPELTVGAADHASSSTASTTVRGHQRRRHPGTVDVGDHQR